MDHNSTQRLLAQVPHPAGTIGGDGLGPFGNVADATSGLTGVTRIVSSIIGIMTIAAGMWFLFQFTIGGFNWITAGGDKAKLQSARDRLTNALIGLVVVVGGWAVLALAGQFFNVDFTVQSPGDVINRLTP
jgi:hypothetical protein